MRNHWLRRERRDGVTCFGNKAAHIMGVVVKDTNIDTKMAAVITTANSRNNLPNMPPMNKMGMNTATKEMLMATTVNPMSREPCKHACSKGTPRSRCRVMFSSTTIASSTTKPVAMVKAMRVRLFKLKPMRYITTQVPAKDKGRATAGMSAVCQRFKNKPTTKITSAMDKTKDFCISSNDARTVGERSNTTAILTAAGKPASNVGKIWRTLSTVSITLPPGCKFSTNSTAG